MIRARGFAALLFALLPTGLTGFAAEAPAPATAARQPRSLAAALGDGWKSLPDWRGVWQLEGPLLFAGPQNAVLSKDAAPVGVVIRGVAFDDGLAPGSHFTGAPYKPEYQQLYDERIAQARATGKAEDRIENCWLPHGMPRLIGAGPGVVEFHLTPKQTWIIWDRMNQTRRIRTDGSGHPSDEEWPRVMGDSIGHWEGATLVVDTVWMKEGVYDRSGAPHSDELRLTERITRTDPDTITVEMTLEDPVMFTRPWQVTRRYQRVPQPAYSVRGTYCEVGDLHPIQLEHVR